MKTKQIQIFDTTLRDGQQCPGAGMTLQQNINYAHLAAKMGIHILEAGFPAASQHDFEIVKTIANEIPTQYPNIKIAALCQLRESQIETTLRALESATHKQRARLHLYLPVNQKLMLASLGDYATKTDKILNDLHTLIFNAKKQGIEIQFSPEGYSKIEHNVDFVSDVLRAVVSAGATIINCPDTIGGACWLQDKDYFVTHMNQHATILKKEFPDINLTWSVHCHNDLGLALHNTIQAVFFGPATQIEGCINGVGERAGNVALEQCILFIKQFSHFISEQKIECNIDTAQLQTISDFVHQHMLTRQVNWPITGDNAFKHTSGGHTNSLLKDPSCYHIIHPHDVGREISFIFGPLSGGNHAKKIVEKFGYQLNEKQKYIFAQFIKNKFSHRRKGISDTEVIDAFFQFQKTISGDIT